MKSKLKKIFRNGLGKNTAIKAETTGDNEATIYIYDAIGDWYGVEAADFVKTLKDLDAGTIHLRINSPGGDVFDAKAMQTAIKEHPAKVIAHIDGLAASAASFLVMGSDEIRMSAGAFLMIHKVWTYMPGNADELRETAAFLDKLDESLVADYIRKTGLDESQIKAWMAAETWFTANEALEHGFIDSIKEEKAAENCFNLTGYKNTPKQLLTPANETPKYDRAAIERRLSLIEKTA